MKKPFVAFIAGAALLAVLGGTSTAFADSLWSKFQGDSRNSGCSDVAVKGNKVLWTTYDDWGSTGAGVAVGSGGILYNTSYKGLVARNPNGSIKWTYSSESGHGVPAIAKDGTVYYIAHEFDSEPTKVYAIKSDGTLKWSRTVTTTSHPLDDHQSISMDSYGNLYLGTLDGSFYFLKGDTGVSLFSAKIESISNGPAIRPDGTIIMTDSYGVMYAFNRNGTRKWTTNYCDFNYTFYCSPVVGLDNTTYMVSGYPSYPAIDGVLSAVDANGKVKWTTSIGGSYGGPSLGADGTIYVIAGDSSLRAYSQDGKMRWSHRASDTLTSFEHAPIIDGAGIIYYTVETPNTYQGRGYLIAVNPDGTERWRMDCIPGALSIGPQGQLYMDNCSITCMVPEPSSIFALVCGLGAMGGVIRRKRIVK